MEPIAAAVAAFISTNIDDVLVLSVLLAGRDRRWKVVTGQYLGMALLIVISIIASYGADILLSDHIWLLGIIPVALGIREAFSRSDDDSHDAIGITGTALLTVSNGADNLGVYIPLFSQCDPEELLLTISVFIAMIAVLCLLSMRLASSGIMNGWIRKYRKAVISSLFILLGLYIMIQGF